MHTLGYHSHYMRTVFCMSLVHSYNFHTVKKLHLFFVNGIIYFINGFQVVSL